jgi:tetratricopeptide (TPR) repeat protein
MRKRSEYVIWASFVPVYALAVAAFYVSDRYQLPLLVPLCVGAGAAIDAIAKAAFVRDWRSLAVPAIALLVLLVWVNRPLPFDEGVAEERTRMAERLVTLGRYDEAERWTERAAEVQAQPGIVHFRVAEQLAAHDRYESAIAHFQKALMLDPNQPIVSYALGATLLEAARPQEAIAHLRRAFESGDHPDMMGYELVRALGAVGQREEAIRVLERVRPARDDDAERWVALGQLALQLRDARLTQTFARKAIALRPDFAAAHGQLGDSLNLEGRWSDAVGELDEAIRLDPRNAAAHVGHAVADASLGRPDDARRHIDEALRLDPRSEPARRVQQALQSRRP